VAAAPLAAHDWRAEQLERLGISRIVAQAVASFVDWHELARLIERARSPGLALEIVR
jgi:predicted component of type VI protein secretion system